MTPSGHIDSVASRGATLPGQNRAPYLPNNIPLRGVEGNDNGERYSDLHPAKVPYEATDSRSNVRDGKSESKAASQNTGSQNIDSSVSSQPTSSEESLLGKIAGGIYKFLLKDIVDGTKAVLQIAWSVAKLVALMQVAPFLLLIGKGDFVEKTFKSELGNIKKVWDENAEAILMLAVTVAGVVSGGIAAAGGMIAVRQLFKAGAKEAVKQIARVWWEKECAGAVKELSKVGLHKLLPMAKRLPGKCGELGEGVAKALGRELFSPENITKLEGKFAEIFEQGLSKIKGGSVEDAAKVLTDVAKKQKDELIDEVSSSLASKLERVLDVIDSNVAFTDPASCVSKLVKKGFSEDEAKALIDIMKDKDIRVALRSGSFDKALQKNLSEAIKTKMNKELDALIQSGEFGKEYFARCEKFLAENGDTLSKEQIEYLNANMKGEYQKMWKEGIEEGVDKGVSRALRRFRAKTPEDVKKEDAEERKKDKKAAKVEPSKATDGGHFDSQDSSKQQVNMGKGFESKFVRPVQHWAQLYFKQVEQLKETAGRISGGLF